MSSPRPLNSRGRAGCTPAWLLTRPALTLPIPHPACLITPVLTTCPPRYFPTRSSPLRPQDHSPRSGPPPLPLGYYNRLPYLLPLFPLSQLPHYFQGHILQHKSKQATVQLKNPVDEVRLPRMTHQAPDVAPPRSLPVSSPSTHPWVLTQQNSALYPASWIFTLVCLLTVPCLVFSQLYSLSSFKTHLRCLLFREAFSGFPSFHLTLDTLLWGKDYSVKNACSAGLSLCKL